MVGEYMSGAEEEFQRRLKEYSAEMAEPKLVELVEVKGVRLIDGRPHLCHETRTDGFPLYTLRAKDD